MVLRAQRDLATAGLTGAVVAIVLGCACGATPAPPAASPRWHPYVPQEVIEDRTPPAEPAAPTVADPIVAEVDRSLEAVRTRIEALPRTDAGVTQSSPVAACLYEIRAQIADVRRGAEDVRDEIRAAARRGGDDTFLGHRLAIVRAHADRAARLAGACR